VRSIVGTTNAKAGPPARENYLLTGKAKIEMNLTSLGARDKSQFYLQPAFQYRTFVWASLLVLLDISLFAATLARRWMSLPPVIIFLMTLSVVGLSSLWYVALRIQRQVHRLFDTHVIDRPQKNSPLDAMLCVASHMTEWGLFMASISVGACIEALGELSRLH